MLSAPSVTTPIRNGSAEITGDFTEAEARSLSNSLKFGALPVKFANPPTRETIGATLAGDQLSAGLIAGIIGLLIVMIYCLLYYRGLGLVVIASLVMAAAITYVLVLLLSKAAGFTLTLPGIAGLIVAVGITADSFIVYFERIRDEMREGKSMRVAVETGWARARATCLAADAVSLLAAVVLYIFAIGVVKGFAFALGLTTLDRRRGVLLVHQADDDAARAPAVLQLRRQALRAVTGDPRHRQSGHRRRPARHRGREGLMGRFSKLGNDLYEGRKSIDFVGRKWLWYAVSGLIVLLAVFGLTSKGLNLGVEFEGGVEYTVSVPQRQATQANADKITDAVIGDRSRRGERPDRRTPPATRRSAPRPACSTTTRPTRSPMRSSRPPSRARQVSEQAVGPSWGQQVAERAITGLVVFLVLVVLFIWAYFREWKMSVAALVALAHDIIITVGVYALSGFEVTPATVTGLLAILGFSLYDTVVVFDKVRENTKDLRKSRKTYAELANLAVNQSLVRSINTSIVALLPVGALLYVGVFSTSVAARCATWRSRSSSAWQPAPTRRSSSRPRCSRSSSRARRACRDSDARARARKRRDVDRYANVPAADRREHAALRPRCRPGSGRRRHLPRSAPRSSRRRAGRPPPAVGSHGARVALGRCASRRSAKRSQPSRQPRSKRKP